MKYHKLLDSMEAGAGFKGYTIDELRYMRAYTSARIEMERGKLTQVGQNFMQTGSLSGQTTWVRRVLNCFSYFDYALIMFKLVSSVMAFRRVRRH